MTSPDTLSGQTLRIIDANLNRIGEGLRLLEDISRLLLNDRELTEQLKNMRHEILERDLPFNLKLLQARDAEGDIGINIKAIRQEERKELPLVAVANSRRVQESLRVLEEIAKSVTDLDSDKYKQARFDLYGIEQTLLSRLLRQDKIKLISGLQIIIDTHDLKMREAVGIAGKAIAGGARAIYLFDKVRPKRELLPVAVELRKLCSEHNVLFIINGHLDIALAADADGLHLEQDSLPVKVVRKYLPIDKILGCSVSTAEQAGIAQSEGVDYIAVGSMHPIAKAPDLRTLRQVKKMVTLPVVAMGAINVDNVKKVLAAGADAVALVSMGRKANIEKEARLIAKLYEEQ